MQERKRGVEMDVHEVEAPRRAVASAAFDGGRHRDATLALERQFDDARLDQRQRRDDRVAAIFGGIT